MSRNQSLVGCNPGHRTQSPEPQQTLNPEFLFLAKVRVAKVQLAQAKALQKLAQF